MQEVCDKENSERRRLAWEGGGAGQRMSLRRCVESVRRVRLCLRSPKEAYWSPKAAVRMLRTGLHRFLQRIHERIVATTGHSVLCGR